MKIAIRKPQRAINIDKLFGNRWRLVSADFHSQSQSINVNNISSGVSPSAKDLLAILQQLILPARIEFIPFCLDLIKFPRPSPRRTQHFDQDSLTFLP